MNEVHYNKVKKVLGLLQGEEGFVGREIPGALLLLPAEAAIEETATEGSTLLYRPSGFLKFLTPNELGVSEKPQIKNKVIGALDEFVSLAFPSETERKSSSDIIKFAKRWGGLSLCGHGLPHTHEPAGDLLADPSRYFIRCLPTVAGGMFAEPVRLWRELAERAFVAMRFAATLRQSFNPETDLTSRQMLIRIANKWLSNGGVTVRFADTAHDRRWPEGVELRLHVGAGLYGVLGAQLALAVTLSRALHVCAECGRLFAPEPSHRPRTGRRAFCLKCGRPAAVRWAMRDFRQRESATLQLAAEEARNSKNAASLTRQSRNDLKEDDGKKTRTK